MRPSSLLALLLITLCTLPVQAGSRAAAPQPAGSAAEKEVLRDFERILDLWRDGSYDLLFERTGGGQGGKEFFAGKLASAPRRPACCWEKMQEVSVALSGEHAALVRARLGFEGNVSGTEFVTRAIKLRKVRGVWTMSQSDLFSLAQVSKKRRVYKYLPIQPRATAPCMLCGYHLCSMPDWFAGHDSTIPLWEHKPVGELEASCLSSLTRTVARRHSCDPEFHKAGS